jgi:hypothetical protein
MRTKEEVSLFLSCLFLVRIFKFICSDPLLKGKIHFGT